MSLDCVYAAYILLKNKIASYYVFTNSLKKSIIPLKAKPPLGFIQITNIEWRENMGTVLKGNELNQFEKGTVLFKKGEQVRFFGMIAKGSIRISGSGIQRIARQGALIGIVDLFYSEYLSDYSAEEDTIFYAFRAIDPGLLQSFLNSNFDYRGIAVYSMEQELSDYMKERELLLEKAEGMYEGLKGLYGSAGEVSGDKAIQRLLEEEPKDAFLLPCGEKKLAFYLESAKVSLDLHKKFYYSSPVMAFYQAGEMAGLIRDIMNSCEAAVNYMEEVAFYNSPSSEDASEEDGEEGPVLTQEEVMGQLKGSLAQILKFAFIEKEEQEEIVMAMNTFAMAKDRLSVQDDMRKIKKQITGHFYKVYQNCLFKWFENKNVPLAVKLFLNYGYMDERLLDEDQILFLCERMNEKQGKLICPIYTMPEWLEAIYRGKKEPSRDSFEEDYRDTLRKQLRSGKITEKQEKEYLSDTRRKVIFEIENMLTSNNKIINGKLSTYVPVLYKDEIYGHLDRLYVTKKQLCDCILDLEKKDFTVFKREVMYTNPSIQIEREHVIKQVYPDVILTPVYGTASSMWQEITGKRRDTPGRFLFPVISENELHKLVTKAFGRFHWEYCRCEMGAMWNNIQYKSLTSEYMDYIQYYRKNHNLSEEKREKIKTQILRARNNTREIFLSDYEMWIYSEANAAMKLNKVSRLILATYCPFNKEMRESLKSNAAFVEAMAAHQRMFHEKTREWELRIKKRENNGLPVPQEFYDTYSYYANN